MAEDSEGRGFAGMDPDKQRKIASMGGKAAHEQGVAHEFSHREAVQAGRKGGEAVSRDREHMAQIGRKGGEATGGHASSRGSSHGGGGNRGGASSRGGSEERSSKSDYGEDARKFLEKEIKHHVEDKGMPQDQAVAAAMSEARRQGYKIPDESR